MRWLGLLLLIIISGSVPCIARAAQSDAIREEGSIDAALKEGRVGQAWEYFLSALDRLEPDSDIDTRLAMLGEGMEIALVSLDPLLARQILATLEQLHQQSAVDWSERDQFLRVAVYTAMAEYQKVDRILDTLVEGFDTHADDSLVAMVFASRAIVSWLEHKFTHSDTYSEAILTGQFYEAWSIPEAMAQMAYALAGSEKASNTRSTETLLSRARKVFEESDCGILYHVLLAELVRLHFNGAISELSAPILIELSSASALAVPNLAVSGLAAKAELAAREGNFDTAFTLMRQCRERSLKGALLSQRARLQWQPRNLMLLEPPNSRGLSLSPYEITVVMLLGILILVLVLRIRTQRIVNLQLRESVEMARLAEEAAEQADNLKTEFISNVSHEIKTPMSGLIGMSSILDELVTDPAQRKYLDTIKACSRNLLVMLNDLLDLGRIEANSLHIRSTPFDLRKSIAYCEQVVGMEAGKKHLAFSVEIDSEVPLTILGDSTRLEQILVNLLNNAIKYTDRGSVSLTVAYELVIGTAGNLVFSITDTGSGIDPDKVGRIFEPFVKGAKDAGTTPPGRGLGLTISKRLAEHMGGVITVLSKPGEGSTFTLRMPNGGTS